VLGTIKRDLEGRQVMTVTDKTNFTLDLPIINAQQLAVNAANAVDFVRAITATVPPDVKAQGPASEDYYRRLIANGLSTEQAKEGLQQPGIQKLIVQNDNWREAQDAYTAKGLEIPLAVKLAIADGHKIDFTNGIPEVVSPTGCATNSSGCRFTLRQIGYDIDDPASLKTAATIAVSEAETKINLLSPRIAELIVKGGSNSLSDAESIELQALKTELQGAVNIYELCAGSASGNRAPVQSLLLNTGLGDTGTFAGQALLRTLGDGARDFQRIANKGDGIDTADDVLFLLAPQARSMLVGATFVFRDGVAYLLSRTGQILGRAEGDVSATALARIATAAADREAGLLVKTEPLVQGGGLRMHEDLGGHLLQKHVGWTDAQLTARAMGQSQGGASTFSSVEAAEYYVSQTLATPTSQAAIAKMLADPTLRKAELDAVFATTTGRFVPAGGGASVNVNNVRVVIVPDARLPGGYRILTGFPKP
jgi:Bacterial CdiA-CT RNAse A domain